MNMLKALALSPLIIVGSIIGGLIGSVYAAVAQINSVIKTGNLLGE